MYIITITMNEICEHCQYEWSPRVEQPVSCPRCKRRFDYLDIE